MECKQCNNLVEMRMNKIIHDKTIEYKCPNCGNIVEKDIEELKKEVEEKNNKTN